MSALSAYLARDVDIALRLQAIRSLGRAGNKGAAPVLRGAFAFSSELEEQVAIVRALGQLQDAEAVSLLTIVAQTEEEIWLRFEAVVALGTIRGGDGIATLIALLDDPLPAIQFAAVQGLRERRAQGALPSLLALGQKLAGQIDQPDSPTSSEPLQRRLAQIEIQRELLRTVTELAPAQGLDLYLNMAVQEDLPKTDLAALKLAAERYELRRVALYGLGYTDSTKAEAFLRGPYGLGERDPRLRALSLRSLAVLGFPEAVTVITPYVEDQSLDVRLQAAVALGRLGDPAAVPALLVALTDGSSLVRREAAQSLAYLGATTTIPTLEALADTDPDESVRAAASDSLKLLRNKEQN